MAYTQGYYREHKQEIAMSRHAHYIANRERILTAQRTRYAEDPEVRKKAAADREAYRKTHRERVREVNRAAYRRNPGAHARRERAYNDRKRRERLLAAGITDPDHCAICGTGPGKTRLHIDHSHSTGKTRGLLCSRCNTSLGGFRDDVDLLKKAIGYLEVSNT